MQADFFLQRELKNEFEHGRLHSPSAHMHFHSHIEIYVIHGGEMEMIIRDQRRVMGAGEICVAFGYDPHGYRTLTEADAEYLIVPQAECREILPLLADKRTVSPFINDREAYRTVSDAMERLSLGVNEVTRRGLVYVILGTILDKVELAREEKHRNARLSPDMLIYIGAHYREPLTLAMLARQFGYNASYLSRSFQETFGVSFCRYVTMMRLRDAVMRLQEQNASITQCATESGFGSMRSFYRAFREEFGMTPNEYLGQLH